MATYGVNIPEDAIPLVNVPQEEKLALSVLSLELTYPNGDLMGTMTIYASSPHAHLQVATQDLPAFNPFNKVQMDRTCASALLKQIVSWTAKREVSDEHASTKKRKGFKGYEIEAEHASVAAEFQGTLFKWAPMTEDVCDDIAKLFNKHYELSLA